MPTGQQGSAAAPPKPTNPVDLLSDLFADVSTQPTPAPAAAAAPPAAYPGAAAAPAYPQYPPQAAPQLGAQYSGGVAPPQYGVPAPQYPGALQAYPGVPQPGMPQAAPQGVFPGAAPYGAVPPVLAPPQAVVPPPPAAPGPAPLQASTSFGAAAPMPAPVPDFGAPAFGAAAPPPEPAASVVPGLEPARPTGSVDTWLSSLLVKDRGILYEDQYLQIGVQSRYARTVGQVILFLGNKNSELALQSVALVAAPPAGLQVSMTPVPTALAPKQQVQVPLQVVASAPFQGAPVLSLSYVIGGLPVQQQLRLPILPHKFVVPEPSINTALFFEQWKAYK